ncbi:hypothetical protein [Achromobacter xylosoxidans]|uniref:hypothetical protein n=1 Tax=Alcaligenes xylosoxydans xylosoxydans TaxID=85698 RepID=UPI001178189E|nr:hypothetical protein [Achromobacter xylosoxidans]
MLEANRLHGALAEFVRKLRKLPARLRGIWPLCIRSPRYFKGRLRSHSNAVELGVIDPRIRDLVGAFNREGVVSSISSCEGHRRWGLATRRTAFVMFSANTILAARLAARIRHDQTEASELHHYWQVDATFNVEGEMVFCLSCPDRRFNRRDLDADFIRLTWWLDEILHAEHSALPREPEIPSRACDHSQ